MPIGTSVFLVIMFFITIAGWRYRNRRNPVFKKLKAMPVTEVIYVQQVGVHPIIAMIRRFIIGYVVAGIVMYGGIALYLFISK